MADTYSSNPEKTRTTGFGSKLFVSICVVLLCVVVLAFLVLSSGQVRGHEFCPESFSLREVSYFQLPLVRMQVTPAIRTDQSTNPLLAHIRGRKFWSRSNQPANWDLAYAEAPGMDYLGDANVWYEYLVTETPDGQNPWVEWSRTHPDLADVLWPAVVDAARCRRYLLIPHLLHCARDADSVDQLQSALEQLRSDAGPWLAELDTANTKSANRNANEP